MKNGVGLSHTLSSASAAAAQRAAGELARSKIELAAIDAGAAIEYAAKAVIASEYGPAALLQLKDVELTAAQKWVLGDREVGMPVPDVRRVRHARAGILAARSIRAGDALNKAIERLPNDSRGETKSAGDKVLAARNAAVHLGDVDIELAELADSLVVAVESLWSIVRLWRVSQWGTWAPVASPGVLGRRNTWQEDKAIRIAMATEQLYGIGVAFARRQRMLCSDLTARCLVCKSPAFLEMNSPEQPPQPMIAGPDGTTALFDCALCGLTLWGEQTDGL